MKSRYIKTTRTKMPRRRRSERLYGSFEDSGKFIKCWNCGFIVDLTRIMAGDGSGVLVTDEPFEELNILLEEPYFHPGHGLFPDTGLTRTIIVDINNGDIAILKTGQDGNAITDYYTPRMAKGTSGCPSCGTRNLP